MSDSPSIPAPPTSEYSVLLSDGRSFGPANIPLLVQWAREGRIPADALLQCSDGSPPVRASESPHLAPIFSAPPTVGGPISMPAGADSDGGISVLIPYRNGLALGAYYTGVFSLIPCAGILLGPTAIVLGILGLRHATKHANAKGRVHAWVGIILGSLAIIGHIVGFVIMSKFK